MLLEFGLRRAQGLDGGVSASRYAPVPHATSTRSRRQFGIPVKGTHAHSYVQAHVGMADITHRRLAHNPEARGASPGTDCPDFVALVYESLDLLNREVRDSLPEAQRWGKTNESELAAFASYALAFPSGFLALVDTYDVLKSGVPNFLAVARAAAVWVPSAGHQTGQR